MPNYTKSKQGYLFLHQKYNKFHKQTAREIQRERGVRRREEKKSKRRKKEQLR